MFASVSAGYYHICGVTTAGAAYCWGYNSNGVLGDGTTADNTTRARRRWAYLRDGERGCLHTCGVTTNGAAYCWERGAAWRRAQWQAEQHSRAGRGRAHLRERECRVPPQLRELTTAGAAYCWGEGYYGELGVGSTEVTNTPTAVLGGRTFKAVSAGRNHSCGVTAMGAAYCWGRNASWSTRHRNV